MVQTPTWYRSANVVVVPPMTACPTAVQTIDDAHETPARELLDEPGGAGVDSMVQTPTWYRSANVVVVPPMTACPTAVQTIDDAHDTPLR